MRQKRSLRTDLAPLFAICLSATPAGVEAYAFDVMAMDGEDLRDLPLSMRKANLARLLRGRPDGMFIAPFEKGEISGPISGSLQFRA